RIGPASVIDVDCYYCHISGSSATDQFILNGGITHESSLIVLQTINLIGLTFSRGTLSVPNTLEGITGYNLDIDGADTSMTISAPQIKNNASLSITNGARAAITNGVFVYLPYLELD